MMGFMSLEEDERLSSLLSLSPSLSSLTVRRGTPNTSSYLQRLDHPNESLAARQKCHLPKPAHPLPGLTPCPADPRLGLERTYQLLAR